MYLSASENVAYELVFTSPAETSSSYRDSLSAER